MFASVDKKEIKLPVKYSLLKSYEKAHIRFLYSEKQQGFCYYCANPLNSLPTKRILGLGINRKLFPPNFFDYPIHLHHNHDTDLTIGAVHALCNAVLFQYEGE